MGDNYQFQNQGLIDKLNRQELFLHEFLNLNRSSGNMVEPEIQARNGVLVDRPSTTTDRLSRLQKLKRNQMVDIFAVNRFSQDFTNKSKKKQTLRSLSKEDDVPISYRVSEQKRSEIQLNNHENELKGLSKIQKFKNDGNYGKVKLCDKTTEFNKNLVKYGRNGMPYYSRVNSLSKPKLKTNRGKSQDRLFIVGNTSQISENSCTNPMITKKGFERKSGVDQLGLTMTNQTNRMKLKGVSNVTPLTLRTKKMKKNNFIDSKTPITTYRLGISSNVKNGSKAGRNKEKKMDSPKYARDVTLKNAKRIIMIKNNRVDLVLWE